jgi:hypothetical protein
MTYTIHVVGEARPEAKRQRFFRTKAGKAVFESFMQMDTATIPVAKGA